MKKALLAVSFGTTHHDTLDKTIAAIEAELASELPEYDLRRAFTSGMIIRKLMRRDGIEVDDVPSALQRLVSDKYTDVVIQPTHILNGEEYDKLRAQAEPFRLKFKRFSIGKPLLTSVSDYFNAAEAIVSNLQNPLTNEATIMMGHGTEHHANSAYPMLEYVLRDMGRRDMYIATVEGYPELDTVVKRLGAHPEIKKLRLVPVMIVAGDHAKNDMAGDGEDSWRVRLEPLGYEVRCELAGLGENPGIRRIFVEHAVRAAEGADE